MGIKDYYDKDRIIKELEDKLRKKTHSLALEKEKVRKLEQELDHINRQKTNPKAKLRGRKTTQLSDSEREACRLIYTAKENGFKGTIVSKCIEIAAVVGMDYKEVRQFWSKKKLLNEISS